MRTNHFSPNEWGYFSAEGFGLVGHMSCDVMEWVSAHPDFDGSIWFDYGTGEDHVEVTEFFLPVPDSITTPVEGGVAEAA